MTMKTSSSDVNQIYSANDLCKVYQQNHCLQGIQQTVIGAVIDNSTYLTWMKNLENSVHSIWKWQTWLQHCFDVNDYKFIYQVTFLKK